MKICIYGAGVIGSIFTGKLSLAGNDVTVLARGKRFEESIGTRPCGDSELNGPHTQWESAASERR